MTIGTMLIIAGAVCIVFGVTIWMMFIFLMRKKYRRKIELLTDEYRCKIQGNGDSK